MDVSGIPATRKGEQQTVFLLILNKIQGRFEYHLWIETLSYIQYTMTDLNSLVYSI